MTVPDTSCYIDISYSIYDYLDISGLLAVPVLIGELKFFRHTASAGTISRTFVFEICPARRDEQTCASRTSSVVVELTDIPLDNSDYRSVGAQTWEVLV